VSKQYFSVENNPIAHGYNTYMLETETSPPPTPTPHTHTPTQNVSIDCQNIFVVGMGVIVGVGWLPRLVWGEEYELIKNCYTFCIIIVM
jgi:hypothetical protein